MRFVSIPVSFLLVVGLEACGGNDSWTTTDEQAFLEACSDMSLDTDPPLPAGRCDDILHWARDLFECTPPMAMDFLNTLFDGVWEEDATRREALQAEIERIEVACVRLSQDDASEP